MVQDFRYHKRVFILVMHARKAVNPATNSNGTASVEQLFTGLAWSSDGEYLLKSKSNRVGIWQYAVYHCKVASKGEDDGTAT